MTRGLGTFLALLLAFCICVLHPGLPAVVLLLVVGACALLEDVQPGTEDPRERREERDRS